MGLDLNWRKRSYLVLHRAEQLTNLASSSARGKEETLPYVFLQANVMILFLLAVLRLLGRFWVSAIPSAAVARIWKIWLHVFRVCNEGSSEWYSMPFPHELQLCIHTVWQATTANNKPKEYGLFQGEKFYNFFEHHFLATLLLMTFYNRV